MYSPIHDGIAKTASSVFYGEAVPEGDLSKLVHSFWELRTLTELTEDFYYHALPDACVNLLFNQVDTEIAGVTALRTRAEALNLGRSFHYVGVQFYPGVWQGSREEIVDSYVGTPYAGTIPLVPTNQQMFGLGFEEQISVLSNFVRWCMGKDYVKPNIVTARILKHLDEITTVSDMASLVGLSTRHLRRLLKQSIGMSPQDLLKVLRLQQSFRKHYLDLYADQSHFIHSFRSATGYTPETYRKRFGL